jgi:phage/plasmid-like protein (TIGR03299 family)
VNTLRHQRGSCQYSKFLRLREDFEVTKDDPIARYLLLSNTHDGTGSVQVKFTPVRIVCQNTLSQALGQGPSIRVAHTPEMQLRLRDAANVVVAAIQRHFDDVGNRFKEMLKAPMSKAIHDAYLKAVFEDPVRSKDQKQYKRAVEQAHRDRLESARLCFEGRGNDIDGVRGTLWAGYNGVTEYVDFHRSTFGENKWLENIWFGEGNRIKERALEEALSISCAN